MGGDEPASDDVSNSDRTRRGYLALASLVTAGLAGCNSLLGSGNPDDGNAGDDDGADDGGDVTTSRPPLTTIEGPASFDRFRLDGPGETTVDEEVPLTVSAVNVGSEAGNFEGTIRTVEGAQAIERAVSVAAVDPGDRATAEVSVPIELADDYVLGVGDGGGQASHEVAVTPRTAAVGGTHELGDGLRVTLTGVSYEGGVFYTERSMGASPTAYYAPGGEEILAVLRFTVENTATGARRFGASVTPSPGTVLTEYPSGSIGKTETFQEAPLLRGQGRGASVQAGQRTEGWVLAQVPRSAASDGIAVNWQRDATGTRPERTWTVDGTALPSFALSEWTLPAESPPGETGYSVTVRNEGDADAVFRGAIDWGRPEGGNWNLRQQLSETIPAGGSHTFERSDRWPYVDDRAVRLRPLGETRTVDFVAPTMAVGESLATPFGSITVTAVTTGDQLVSSPGRGDNRSTKTPEAGQFLFVEVEYSRQFEVSIPNIGRLRRYSNGFLLHHGDAEYEYTLPGGDHDFHRPVSGRPLNTHRGDQVPVGEARRGWLVFDVPPEVSPGDATVTWHHPRDDHVTSGTWELG
jgi:hypothetical protein